MSGGVNTTADLGMDRFLWSGDDELVKVFWYDFRLAEKEKS